MPVTCSVQMDESDNSIHQMLQDAPNTTLGSYGSMQWRTAVVRARTHPHTHTHIQSNDVISDRMIICNVKVTWLSLATVLVWRQRQCYMPSRLINLATVLTLNATPLPKFHAALWPHIKTDLFPITSLIQVQKLTDCTVILHIFFCFSNLVPTIVSLCSSALQASRGLLISTTNTARYVESRYQLLKTIPGIYKTMDYEGTTFSCQSYLFNAQKQCSTYWPTVHSENMKSAFCRLPATTCA